jgi:hypothetical protein
MTDRIPAQITGPTEAERAWIAGYVEAAGDLAARLVPDTATPLSVDDLDAVWAAWLATDPPPAEANGVVHAVGLAFGQLLVDELGMHWVVVAEEDGIEAAVQDRPGSETLLFPASFVAEFWPTRATGILRPARDELVRVLSGGR